MEKIIVSANSGWNLYNYRKSFLREISKKKKLIILCPKDKYLIKLKKIINFKFYEIKISSIGKNLFEEIRIIIQYYKIFYREKPHKYLAFTIKPNLYGSLVSKFLKIQTYNFVTGLGTVFLKSSFLQYFIILVYKLAVKGNNIVYFQNCEDKNYFIKKKIIYKKQSRIFLGFGINIKKFNSLKIKYKKNKKLVYYGRLIDEKGLFEYLLCIEKIKKKHQECQFIFYGNFDKYKTSKNLKEKFNFLKKNNSIKLYNKKENPLSILKDADCIVLPSYREGLSQTLIEGLAAGKFLIASNVPGCNNLVSNNINGYLFNSKSTIGLYNVIKKYINLHRNNEIKIRTLNKKKSKKFESNNLIKFFLNSSNLLK